MIEMSQLTVLIMIEVIVGLAIACGVLAYLATTRKERIRKAAQHLAERVQSDQPARTKRLKGLLSEQYGYADNELEQILHNITQAEMRLFENLINGYMKDDQVHLQQIDVDEENLVLAYQELKLGQAGSLRPATADEGSGKEELQQLQDENKRLSDELRVTMDTMGRMLNEYSSMFAGGQDKPLTRVAPVEPAESAPETVPGADEIEVDIPDLQASDLAVEPMPMDPDEQLESDAETASALDEEVSEIIDEVMEMADDIGQDVKVEPAPEEPTADVGESLVDELEQVDIELPETAQAQVPDASEAEAASLEEEWAKLLENEADSKEKSDDKSS